MFLDSWNYTTVKLIACVNSIKFYVITSLKEFESFLKNFNVLFLYFLFFEKNYSNIFFSKSSKWNCTLCYTSAKQIKATATFLRFETLKNFFYLADASVLNNFVNDFKIKQTYVYYIFTSAISGSSVVFFVKYSNLFNQSLNFLFKNTNWLEREMMEMYGIFFKYKKDYRKLLLDYTKKINPLKKNFNCEGSDEYFYNFFENQVCYINNSCIEL